ncbi:adenylyltransferase/cytidyltransferase family protein [Glutamicibacter sp. BW77]|uniref:adenylyltransferase/cytidyltransferase family protein n=1 Tax=Glutamicibacter TaxID=1742989 RepID=UPI000BB69E03|nr:adenylyltransferase/cytidyltransferase family protein [Glutamicibacter sp. BW77]PCC34442.1 cytidyltransferase [Glutamicibacter sp. BW77]
METHSNHSQNEPTRRIGYAVGAFDLFHIGHLNLIKQAKSQCNELIVGVVGDDLLEQRKGRRPAIPENERLEIVRNLVPVDHAVLEITEDRLETWEQLQYNVFFKGDDWKGTPKGHALEEQFAKVGVQVHYFPYTIHTSSTILRQALKALGETTEAVGAQKI